MASASKAQRIQTALEHQTQVCRASTEANTHRVCECQLIPPPYPFPSEHSLGAAVRAALCPPLEEGSEGEESRPERSALLRQSPQGDSSSPTGWSRVPVHQNHRTLEQLSKVGAQCNQEHIEDTTMFSTLYTFPLRCCGGGKVCTKWRENT